MTLARMISEDEDALFCDMAEIYHVFDMESLPFSVYAKLANGLPDSSRIKRILSGSKLTVEQTLLAVIADRLTWLQWAKTEDGAKNMNRPKSILDMLTGTEDNKKTISFDTPDAFERELERLRKA